MRGTDGIEHVIRLIVGGTVEPEFAHRHIHMLIMQHAVAGHGGGHGFRADAASEAGGFLFQGTIEFVIDQFGDRLADIMQDLFGTLNVADRHTHHREQPGHEIVSPAFSEFIGK